jgi:hypothetical protein
MLQLQHKQHAYRLYNAMNWNNAIQNPVVPNTEPCKFQVSLRRWLKVRWGMTRSDVLLLKMAINWSTTI